MPRFKLVDGVSVQLTADEETARDAEETAWANGAFDRAMTSLRAKRNDLLVETDFYGNSDVTMTSDMTTYRQNLRDLTSGLSTVDDVNNVTWSTKP